MADDSLSLFTLFDATFPTYNRVNLPKVNPFVSYDDKKFKERFRLSKRVVERLLDEVSDNQTTLFYILSSNSFIPPVCPQTKVTQSGDSRQATLAHVSLRCAAPGQDQGHPCLLTTEGVALHVQVIFCYASLLLSLNKYRQVYKVYSSRSCPSYGFSCKWKNRSEETQTLRAGCSKAEPKNSPRRTPLPGGMGRPKFNQLEMVTTFTYKPSLVRIDTRNFELLW